MAFQLHKAEPSVLRYKSLIIAQICNNNLTKVRAGAIKCAICGTYWLVSFVIDSVTKKQFYYVLCLSLRNCFEFELMIRHSCSKPDDSFLKLKGNSGKRQVLQDRKVKLKLVFGLLCNCFSEITQFNFRNTIEHIMRWWNEPAVKHIHLWSRYIETVLKGEKPHAQLPWFFRRPSIL